MLMLEEMNKENQRNSMHAKIVTHHLKTLQDIGEGSFSPPLYINDLEGREEFR